MYHYITPTLWRSCFFEDKFVEKSELWITFDKKELDSCEELLNVMKEKNKMTMNKISPEALYTRMNNQENIMLLDVRAEEKYNDFHISGFNIESININKTEILKLEDQKLRDETIYSLPKNQEIIVTCTTGNSATKCANILSQYDYKVTVLEGGITSWKKYINSKYHPKE